MNNFNNNKQFLMINDSFYWYNKITVFLLLMFIFIFSIHHISADVISLNAGGSTNLSVTSDKYIEGFFSGIEEAAAGGGGGGGGGGAGGGGAVYQNISVSPREFNINLKINTNVEKRIRVTNSGSSPVVLGVSQQGLDNLVLLGNTSLTIPVGQAVEMKVIFVAPKEPGILTGKIIIGGIQVLVSLNIKTEFLLFDSNIVVLNKNYTVTTGEQLKTLVNLIPLGNPERLDVTLNFIIKDYLNKIYLTKTETLLVQNQTNLRRNFDTGILPSGDYIIGLELVYPNGVAPSSAHFRVVERSVSSIFGRIVLFLIILILIILIIILLTLIIRKLRQKRQTEIEGVSST